MYIGGRKQREKGVEVGCRKSKERPKEGKGETWECKLLSFDKIQNTFMGVS